MPLPVLTGRPLVGPLQLENGRRICQNRAHSWRVAAYLSGKEVLR